MTRSFLPGDRTRWSVIGRGGSFVVEGKMESDVEGCVVSCVKGSAEPVAEGGTVPDVVASAESVGGGCTGSGVVVARRPLEL